MALDALRLFQEHKSRVVRCVMCEHNVHVEMLTVCNHQVIMQALPLHEPVIIQYPSRRLMERGL